MVWPFPLVGRLSTTRTLYQVMSDSKAKMPPPIGGGAKALQRWFGYKQQDHYTIYIYIYITFSEKEGERKNSSVEKFL